MIKGLIIGRLNQVWIADITYVRILTSFVYLAAILSAFSRRVLGYAISNSIDTVVTLKALRKASPTGIRVQV